jgi:hypothetical protein
MENNKNVKVLFTTNLGMFKFHEVNRDFENAESKNRIRRIAESMKIDGVLPIPIIVTKDKFYVVDGQHRLNAAMEAGKGIYYIVNDSIPNTPKGIFDAAKRMNRDAKVWGKVDYIHGLAKQGNQNYKLLEFFGEKYPMFSLTERIMLLMNSGSRSVDKGQFADGKFEITNLKKAEEWANHLLSLKPYFDKGYNKSNFVRTMLTILEKKKEFKFDEFLHKVKLRPTSIVVCGDKKAYAEMIEEIYNYKRKSDDRLNLRF